MFSLTRVIFSKEFQKGIKLISLRKLSLALIRNLNIVFMMVIRLQLFSVLTQFLSSFLFYHTRIWVYPVDSQLLFYFGHYETLVVLVVEICVTF